jgi:hypothetical protein
MSIFDLPRRGQKAGRKPVNGIDSKAKIAVTIDSDIDDLLNKEPNKSWLINDLLRNHYKMPDVARRLKYSLELINKGKFNPLSIAKVASMLGLTKSEILDDYFNGVDEPDFDFLDTYADKFGIFRDWLKFGDGKPFATSEQCHLYASGYLQRIDEIAPEQILFIRADNEEGSTGILLKISDFKFVYMYKTWNLSGKVGGTGQNQIYDFYKLIKLLTSGGRSIVDSDGEEKYIKQHWCGGRIISGENFNKLFCGEIFPGEVVENHENHWWDDFTDITNTSTRSKNYQYEYGKAFVEAQKIVVWIEESINKDKA